jgi:hypothetical protein
VNYRIRHAVIPFCLIQPTKQSIQRTKTGCIRRERQARENDLHVHMVTTRTRKPHSGLNERVDVDINNSDEDDIVIEIDNVPGASGLSEVAEGTLPDKGEVVDASTLDAITGIFASGKSRIGGDRSSMRNPIVGTGMAQKVASSMVWKPNIALPSRNLDPRTSVPTMKHGNSYRRIQEQASTKPPPSKKELSKEWFRLPTQEITDEVKADLRVLRLRSAFDTKRFYRKDDSSKFPTQFHVGRVVEHAADFYSSRLTKKQRKTTMAEEVMHDEHLSAVRKKRFTKIQENATYWSNAAGKGRKTNNPRIKKKPGRKKH